MVFCSGPNAMTPSPEPSGAMSQNKPLLLQIVCAEQFSHRDRKQLMKTTSDSALTRNKASSSLSSDCVWEGKGKEKEGKFCKQCLV